MFTEQIQNTDSGQYDHKRSASVRVPTLEEEKNILSKLENGKEWSNEELEKDRKGVKIFIVECGSKQLLVYLFGGYEFMTIVANNNKERAENETTIVYEKAKEIMQDESNSKGKEMIYSLVTSNEKMLAWARNRGDEIFHWQRITEPNSIDKRWGFITMIEPEKRMEN
ncbi:MAG: hypothetical protein WCT40_02570 [Candidatus Magasanikbacteria bacterium]|jgi:hypothetical protein